MPTAHERVIDELEAFLRGALPRTSGPRRRHRARRHRQRDRSTAGCSRASRSAAHPPARHRRARDDGQLDQLDALPPVHRPEPGDRLRADPTWSPPMVEEALRFEAPVMSMARTVVNESELSGQTLCPGDRVLLAYVSANRDGTVFERADEFVDRPRRQQPPVVRGRHPPVPRRAPRPDRDAGRRRGDHRPHARRAPGRRLRAGLASRPHRPAACETLPVVYTPWA